MYYTYVLYSAKQNKFYIGSTTDLRRRFNQHIKRYNRYTKHIDDWVLVYYEAYLLLRLARKREFKLKSRSNAWTLLKKRIIEDKM